MQFSNLVNFDLEIIFDAMKFMLRQTLHGNVVELAEGYPGMKTIPKSV